MQTKESDIERKHFNLFRRPRSSSDSAAVPVEQVALFIPISFEKDIARLRVFVGKVL